MPTVTAARLFITKKLVLFHVISSGLQSRDVFKKEVHEKGPPWIEIVDAEY